MKYCQRCIIPDTRPEVHINADGVCSACLAHDAKSKIDWPKRAAEFKSIAESVKKGGRGYDCVIPVSGGKDSTWQVITCLEHGFHPLAVTWKPPARTEIGRKNLENLIGLGVDHIDFQINPEVEKKFLFKALIDYGSTAIPMHMALFNIPLTIAVRFDIPLVVWGENSADEYAGEGDENRGSRLTGRWLKSFGVTHGTTAKDWISPELTEKELTPYFGPTEEELDAKGIKAVFLGYYLGWDPEKSLAVAERHGFTRAANPKTGYYNFADIDDDFISIHHYLKWYKFGFTRLFDNLSIEIRNGRMMRDEAIKIIRASGSEPPREDIAKFCAFTGITEEKFFEIIEKFRNAEIWTKRDDKWVIEGFLISDWDWSK